MTLILATAGSVGLAATYVVLAIQALEAGHPLHSIAYAITKGNPRLQPTDTAFHAPENQTVGRTRERSTKNLSRTPREIRTKYT
jgi:hypothetical protein